MKKGNDDAEMQPSVGKGRIEIIAGKKTMNPSRKLQDSQREA